MKHGIVWWQVLRRNRKSTATESEEARKRCESSLRRAAMILSLLSTILQSIFSALASQITEVLRQKQRIRARELRDPFFLVSITPFFFFLTIDKDTFYAQGGWKKKDHEKRIPDESRGWIYVSYIYIYMNVYTYIPRSRW